MLGLASYETNKRIWYLKRKSLFPLIPLKNKGNIGKKWFKS